MKKNKRKKKIKFLISLGWGFAKLLIVIKIGDKVSKEDIKEAE